MAPNPKGMGEIFIMRMKRKGGIALPLAGSRVTATVAVALVLILLGAVAVGGVMARSAADGLRSRLGFTVIMSPDASEEMTAGVRRAIEGGNYAARVEYSSPEQVLARWNASMGEGDDVFDGFNPFLPEIEVSVKSDYASPESLNALATGTGRLPGVHKVKLQTDLVKSINETVRKLSLALIVVAVVLALISMALVNNTVRLSIYSRRFLIHTMRLVGATEGFIRRPFVVSSLIIGAIAGAIAVAVVCAALFYLAQNSPAVAALTDRFEIAWVCAGIFLAGVLFCGLSAAVSVTRYLRTAYDDMF